MAKHKTKLIDGHKMNWYSDETIFEPQPGEYLTYGFIYVTIDKINNKYYVGKSQFKKIVKSKKYEWKNYLGSGVEIRKAIEKYGKQNFKRYIIDLAENEEQLKALEDKYIQFFRANWKENWYNKKFDLDRIVGVSLYPDKDVEMMKHIRTYGAATGLSPTVVVKKALQYFFDNIEY